MDLEPDGNPPRDAVRVLSARIEAALREVILDAQHEEALNTITRAERIFSAGRNDDVVDSLANELQLQQRFIKAYTVLREHQPDRLRKLEVRMLRFEEELKQAGVDPEELSPPNSTTEVFIHLITRFFFFLLLVVPATLGTLVHYPAYRLGGYLATRLSRDSEDVMSTIKIISAMLLFPLTWGLVTLGFYWLSGWLAAAVSLVVIPISGYVAILFFEELDRFLGGLRALTFFLVRRRFFVRLMVERNAIRNEILSLGRETPSTAGRDQVPIS